MRTFDVVERVRTPCPNTVVNLFLPLDWSLGHRGGWGLIKNREGFSLTTNRTFTDGADNRFLAWLVITRFCDITYIFPFVFVVHISTARTVNYLRVTF